MTKLSAMQYVVYLLSRRDYSEFELVQRLKQKGYASEESEQALSQAKSHNWLSDERFCTTFMHMRAQQGYGPRRLVQELRYKGIKEYLITQVMAESEIDWFALAETLFEKKRPAVWDRKAKQKMWRYMVSRGFYTDHFSHLMDLEFDAGYDEFAIE